jgi:hypothetical protein
MTDLPGELGGTNPLKTWGNRVLRAIRRRTLISGVGYKLRQSESGVALEILPGSGGGARITTYRIVSVESDHYVCHSWNETTLEEGDTDILVARPWEHRNSILSETIAGTAYTYTYTPGITTERIANDGSSTETQVIVPYLLTTGDNPTVICAMAANTGVVVLDEETEEETAVTLLDINIAGRAWAH